MRRSRSKIESHAGHHAQRVSQVHAERTSLHDTHGRKPHTTKVLGPKKPKR